MLKFLGWTFGTKEEIKEPSCPSDTCVINWCGQNQKTVPQMDNEEIRRRLLKIVDLVNEAKKQGRY